MACGRDGFTHVVLLGMGGSSLAPEVLRQVLGVRRIPLHRSTSSTRSIPTPFAPRWLTRAHRCSSSPASRARRSSRTTMAAEARRRVDRSRPHAVGHTIRRDHRRRHGAASPCDGRRIPRRLRQPLRYRRPLFGAVALRHGAGGADGHRPRRLLAGARAMESACRHRTVS